jgi:ABC-type dipeptide/oligopeptide/nickel transport system permease component
MTRGTLVYLIQRLFLISFTAVAISSIVFLGQHALLPGDAFLSERSRNETAHQALVHHYRLDLPLIDQYGIWVSGVLHGDLGESLVQRGVKLTPLLVREAGTSAELGFFALIFTVGLGLTLGLAAALKQNTWVDYVASSSAVVGYSMPNFVIATVLVLLTGKVLYNLTGGAFYYDIGWGKPEQILVPAIALGVPYASIVARLTRASMLEVIRQDYVRTAWAKGLRPRIVIIRHALRNALIPVVTILGPLATGILTGVVVIENIFGIPGLGKEFIQSILDRDYNIVIGVFTLYAGLVGLVNLGVDLIYPFLDPRIRY